MAFTAQFLMGPFFLRIMPREILPCTYPTLHSIPSPQFTQIIYIRDNPRLLTWHALSEAEWSQRETRAMANPEHLQILEQGVEAWNHGGIRMRTSGRTSLGPTSSMPISAAPTSAGPTSARADLTRADLSRADLRGPTSETTSAEPTSSGLISSRPTSPRPTSPGQPRQDRPQQADLTRANSIRGGSL